MNLKKTFITSLAVTSLASTMFLPAPTNKVEAAEVDSEIVSLSLEDESRIVTELNDYGVSNKDVNSLINKLKHGILWDSLTDAAPVSEEIKHLDNGDTTQIIYKYEDGSVYVTETIEGEETFYESPSDNSIQPLSVSGGSSQTGSGYTLIKGASVTGSNVLISMKFKADYEQWSGGGGKINNAYDYNISVQPGSYSNPKFTTVNSKNRYLKVDASVNAGGVGTMRTAKLSIIMNSAGKVSSKFEW